MGSHSDVELPDQLGCLAVRLELRTDADSPATPCGAQNRTCIGCARPAYESRRAHSEPHPITRRPVARPLR